VTGEERKQYTFEKNDDSMFITASYKDNQAQEHRKESFRWNITVGEAGFVIENEYSIQESREGPGKKETKLSFRHALLSLVEFVNDDPWSNNETYTDQEVVARYPLNSWLPASYEGECTVDTPCKANFTTSDSGCVSVIVNANLNGISSDNRVSLSPDDIKMDYILSCDLSSNLTAFALIGTVESSEKSSVYEPKGKKGKMSKKGKKGKQHHNDIGVTSEITDSGVSAYFTWLDEVDCGSEEGIVSRPVATITEDAGSDYELNIMGKGKRNGHAKQKYTSHMHVRWAIHTTPTDGICVWDPVLGVETYGSEDFSL
jgi:hypothetical protein